MLSSCASSFRSSGLAAVAVAVVLAAVLFASCGDGRDAGAHASGGGGGSGGSSGAAGSGQSVSGGTTAGSAGNTGSASGSGGAVASGGAGTAGSAPGVGGAGEGGAAGGAGGGAGEGGSGGTGASSSGAGGETAGAGGGGTGGTAGGPSVAPGRACHSTDDWSPAAGDLWISPTGVDGNAGTEASPKKTLGAAIAAWSSGKTIWVMPGTYALSAVISVSTKATSGGPLRISGVTGGAKPVLDFSGETRATDNDGQRGLQLSGSFVHLRYLELEKAADNCIYVTGTDNTLEWLTVHECQDTGVQLSSGAADNQVLNVDSYLNADPTGENADGFAPKLSIGQGNRFCGTRAWQNADDGYDCWSSGDGSPVTFEYCWAFGQPGPTATAQGDGNGFKLGSPISRVTGGNAPHELIECYAFGNRSAGFTSNGNSSGDITCTDCGVWDNGTAWSPGGEGGVLPQHSGDVTNLDVTVDQAINAARDVNGDLPDIAEL